MVAVIQTDTAKDMATNKIPGSSHLKRSKSLASLWQDLVI